ncbi:MAG: 2-oxoacid:acceptor oxidoreductase family protein [Nitrospirota bacterium]
MDKTVNIVFSGTGGFGIITASDICASAAMLSGYDVKKADIRGIAKRGGFVMSSVRYGEKVFSPKVEPGTAHFLISINSVGKPPALLSEKGISIDITPDLIKKYGRHSNLFALGILSEYLHFDRENWLLAIKGRFMDGVMTLNTHIFLEGRDTCSTKRSVV